MRTRVSRILLVREEMLLVLNDRYAIHFQHNKAFMLAWIVCGTLTRNEECQVMGGIVPDDLVQLCNDYRLGMKKNSIATLWHDEIQFRRRHKLAYRLFDVMDLKTKDQVRNLDTWLPDVLGLIFPDKVPPPVDSGLHRNTRLYTVGADPEQILLFDNVAQARQNGFDESGASDVTKLREDDTVIGFLDWRHEVVIDTSGTSHSEVDVTLVNLSATPLLRHMLPLWSHSQQESKDRKLRAWLKDGTELPIEMIIGEEGKKRKIEFLMSLPRPVRTGESLQFRLTYQTLHTYEEGKNYFEWYFGRPHARYEVNLRFEEPWYVERPVVYVGNEQDHFVAEAVSERYIKWTRFFPHLHKTYRIEFTLGRKDV
jgi:hypothetical protein